MNELTWTTTPPTEPGWYWMSGPVIVRISLNWDGQLLVFYAGNDEEKYLSNLLNSKWAGPIPEPKEAK